MTDTKENYKFDLGVKGLTHTIFTGYDAVAIRLARHREAVYSALRVQLALVVCCAPITSKTY